MIPGLLLFGLPTPLLIAIVVILLIVIVFALLKRLFKLALIVGAVVVGVWLARMLLG